MKKRQRVTCARLRELLDYDSDTGEFRWRKTMSNTVLEGDLAGCALAMRRIIGIDGKLYTAHRLAWFHTTGRWGPPTIDHRDGDPTNNRWRNLRRATRSQNNANSCRPRHNSSGFKGVCFHRVARKWQASIGKDRRTIYLGLFATKEDAHAAYVAAAHKLFGEFARTE